MRGYWNKREKEIQGKWQGGMRSSGQGLSIFQNQRSPSWPYYPILTALEKVKMEPKFAPTFPDTKAFSKTESWYKLVLSPVFLILIYF